MRRLRIFLSFAGLFASLPAAAGAQGRVEPVVGLADEADAIVVGPDDAMWASIGANPGRIVRITTLGSVVYAWMGGLGGLPVDRHPSSIASHRGALWFRLSGGPETFARLRLGTPVTPLSLAYGRPTSLTSGPDGALWMTVDGDPDAITRSTSDPPDELSYPLGSGSEPRSIVVGPDRALWFADGSRLGRITTSGELTYRSVRTAPAALAAGPSGSLWYAQGGVVHRLDDPAEYATGSPVAALAAGPDGAMWAAVQGGAARIAPGEAPTMVNEGIDPAARGRAIAAGPDGRMWMTLDRAPYLVKITVRPLVEEASELDGWLSARVNSNGLEGEARAELRQADGTWREVADIELYGSAFPTTVRLRLAGLAPGDNIVRMTAVSSAGTASSRPITIRLPVDPEPTATPVAGASPTPIPTASPVPVAGPVEGKTVEVSVLSGSVSYRNPPSTGYTELKGKATLPLGVLIDTSAGKVRVAAQVDGATQAGTFDGGKFSVAQTSSGMVEMALAGPLDCSKSERARTDAAAAAAKKKKKRLLWGRDSGGSFRTRGNGSVATVRGTEWRTQDSCAGTTIYVRSGVVSVWPRQGGRSKLVRAGQRRFTPRPR